MNTAAADAIRRAMERVEEACYRALDAMSSGTRARATGGLICEKSILTTPSDLPWDIITDILSRLPVKSLMRFKCVSTSFYNLISNDPLFKKEHLCHHQSSLKVLVPDYPDTPPESATSCCNLSVSSAREEIIDLEFPIRIGGAPHGRIYNSCDGLFCIGVDVGDFIIWNPSTRQEKRFPRGHRDDERCFFTCSLAHDSRSNVYKLLGVSYDMKNSLCFYSTEMEMWRCVEDSPPCGSMMRYNGEPTIVNGAFHWLCYHFLNSMPHVVSLDICDETYGVLTMPKAFCDTMGTPILCVTKGKLGMICEIKSQALWEMWLMNEYGVADSMTRLYSFSREEISTRVCCTPLYTPKNSDIIMIYEYSNGTSFCKDGRLFYDTVGSKIKRRTIPYAFFESLISPHTCLENNESNTEIAANKFSTIRYPNLHSHNALPEKACSPEIVESTSRGKHVRTKGKHFLKRLCLCKSFKDI